MYWYCLHFRTFNDCYPTPLDSISYDTYVQFIQFCTFCQFQKINKYFYPSLSDLCCFNASEAHSLTTIFFKYWIQKKHFVYYHSESLCIIIYLMLLELKLSLIYLVCSTSNANLFLLQLELVFFFLFHQQNLNLASNSKYTLQNCSSSFYYCCGQFCKLKKKINFYFLLLLHIFRYNIW